MISEWRIDDYCGCASFPIPAHRRNAALRGGWSIRLGRRPRLVGRAAEVSTSICSEPVLFLRSGLSAKFPWAACNAPVVSFRYRSEQLTGDFRQR